MLRDYRNYYMAPPRFKGSAMTIDQRKIHIEMNERMKKLVEDITFIRREVDKVVIRKEPPLTRDQVQAIVSNLKILERAVEKCKEIVKEEE